MKQDLGFLYLGGFLIQADGLELLGDGKRMRSTEEPGPPLCPPPCSSNMAWHGPGSVWEQGCCFY